MGAKENSVQNVILDYLFYRGHFAKRVNTGGVPVWDKNKKFKCFRPSPNKGIPDIIGCTKEGKMIACEIKAKGGRISEEQQNFINEVIKRKGIGIIAYSIEDLIKAGL